MIPNLINTLIGVCLVSVAVLSPSVLAANGRALPISGLVILAMALWARRTDYAAWHSNVNIALAVVLLLTALVQFMITLQAVVFWTTFWAGIILAIIALWAALYRPQAASQPQQSAPQERMR